MWGQNFEPTHKLNCSNSNHVYKKNKKVHMKKEISRLQVRFIISSHVLTPALTSYSSYNWSFNGKTIAWSEFEGQHQRSKEVHNPSYHNIGHHIWMQNWVTNNFHASQVSVHCLVCPPIDTLRKQGRILLTNIEITSSSAPKKWSIWSRSLRLYVATWPYIHINPKFYNKQILWFIVCLYVLGEQLHFSGLQRTPS